LPTTTVFTSKIGFFTRRGGEGLWTLIETPIDYNIDLDGYSQTMIQGRADSRRNSARWVC
jgi:hypothetical protein